MQECGCRQSVSHWGHWECTGEKLVRPQCPEGKGEPLRCPQESVRGKALCYFPYKWEPEAGTALGRNWQHQGPRQSRMPRFLCHSVLGTHGMCDTHYCHVDRDAEGGPWYSYAATEHQTN